MEYIGIFIDPEYGALEQFEEAINFDDAEVVKMNEGMIKILDEQECTGEASVMLDRIIRSDNSRYMTARRSFALGMILGKQAERQKRKKRETAPNLPEMAVALGKTRTPEELIRLHELSAAFWTAAIAESEKGQCAAVRTISAHKNPGRFAPEKYGNLYKIKV